jgi:GNAT superfamily N-acetyltransferase
VDVLDNPVWHALTGPQSTVAELRSGAARYQRDVAPFSALPDEPTTTSWGDLHDLVGPGGFAILFMPAVAPTGWDVLLHIDAVQMVADAVDPAPCPRAIDLGADDIPDMIALVKRTEPGPFEPRTIELGEYIGIRDESGQLVAMAGERMHPPGFREISAVCTDEQHRGKGFASALVRALVGRIVDRGEVPILHVVTTNAAAIRVYEALGFSIRREVNAIGLRSPH